jgi:hypothetical protein
MKFSRSLVGVAAVLVLALLANWQFGTSRLTRKVQELEQERERLIEYAERLCASSRVAQVTVLSQRSDEAGRTINELLWQEVGTNGVIGRPVNVKAVGDLVYFEAYVIKFDHDKVAEGDADRGASVAMFRRIFGDAEAAQSVVMLDQNAPPILQAEPPASKQETLWDRFWEFVERPDVAAQYGVRVAQCEAPAVPLRTGQIWELSLDSDGGLNVKKVSDGARQISADTAGERENRQVRNGE